MPIRLRLRDARPPDLLAIYVRDHLAGAAGGRALLRRAIGTARQGSHRDELVRLERDVVVDLTALRRFASAVGIERPRVLEALALGAERVGRLKLNGQVLGTSPLSPLLEVEALILGVTGKASCWRTLAGSDLRHRAPDLDLAVLEGRALAQRRDLVQLRDELAALAFAGARAAGSRS